MRINAKNWTIMRMNNQGTGGWTKQKKDWHNEGHGSWSWREKAEATEARKREARQKATKTFLLSPLSSIDWAADSTQIIIHLTLLPFALLLAVLSSVLVASAYNSNSLWLRHCSFVPSLLAFLSCFYFSLFCTSFLHSAPTSFLSFSDYTAFIHTNRDHKHQEGIEKRAKKIRHAGNSFIWKRSSWQVTEEEEQKNKTTQRRESAEKRKTARAPPLAHMKST